MKRVKVFISLLILGGLIYGLSYVWRAFPIVSGYGAKNLCTCVFVAGRTQESVLADELGSMPLSLGTFEVNMADSSATGSVFGTASKKAIFRKGLGCTLISEMTEEEIRSQEINLASIATAPDSLVWPYGLTESDTIFENVDYEALNRAIDNAFAENKPDVKINTRGVVVLYKGHLIGEKYAEAFDKNTAQIGWSMTKSITSTMMGLMVKDGLIKISDNNLIDVWKGDERSKITLDQLLRMSSGLEWEEVYSGPSSATNMLFKSADMGAFAAHQPLEHQPDDYWYYSSGTTNIISRIARERLGEKYHNYLRDRLFSPLGMTTTVLEPDASGTYVGSSYMYASPRDWAKFGQFYLNGGSWNGEQLLPKNWADYVSTPTDKAPLGEYGAHFWLNAGQQDNPENRLYPDVPADLYSANGFEGQRVFIIPSKDMVIVRMGQTKVRGSFDFNEFLKSVLAAVD